MKKGIWVFFAIMALGLVATINADVTIKRQISMEIAGLPSSELISMEQIQGEKSREVTEFIGGGVMAMMGGQQTAEVNITRLDKGVIWIVYDQSKTYVEINMSDYKDMMDQPGAVAPDEANADLYEWTYDTKREDKTTEHGFECQVITTVATGISKENPEDKTELRYEFWMSRDLSGKSELEAYLKRYAEVTGIDQFSQDQMVDRMGTDFGPQLKKLAENFKDLEGYPIKTVIAVRQSGKAGIPGMPEDAEMDPEAAAMMQKMMGGKTAEPSEDGMTTIFSNISEVVGINTDAIDGSLFNIPEGYARQ